MVMKTGESLRVPPAEQSEESAHVRPLVGRKPFGIGKTDQVRPKSPVTYSDSDNKGALTAGLAYSPASA